MKIVFTGDVSFSRFFRNREKEDLLDPNIKLYLEAADHIVINAECAITTREIISERTLNHCSSPEMAGFLEKNNMRVWSLANNHILDCGADGLFDTISFAQKCNCYTIGVGKTLEEASAPLILQGVDCSVGIISLSRDWPFLRGAMVNTWNEQENLKNSIQHLKQEVDWVTLVIHGGDEFSDLALPHIRERYRQYLNFGADVVVAHHPHVVQNYEILDGKMIFYSLGNFIFDTEFQREHVHTDKGILCGINYGKEKILFDFCPVLINRNTHKVEKSTAPKVFCQISKKEYAKLWPIAARIFYYTDIEKRKKLTTRFATMSSFQRIKFELKKCRTRRQRILFWGIIRSFFCRWKFTKDKELLSYILEARRIR